MRSTGWLVCAVAGFCMTAGPVSAQTTEAASAAPADAPLTAEELQKLVAPVALYPDTVLIQVLVAATVPLDVILADRLLKDNADLTADDLEAKIKAKQFDLSVEVLAIAFPDLIHRMAVNIDWTELTGKAMLAQSDDVMAAVQVMRDQAINSGALVDTPEMTVTTDPKTSAVVVQPANPAVVYVPQYDPIVVYANPVGSAVATGLVAFGTIALIDEIFDDDDDWDDYWGCRNCAEWGSGTVIRNPDIDINVNGDVIIGNDVNIVNDLERNTDGRWKPAEERTDAATSDLARRRGTGDTAPVRLDRPATPSDELRSQIGQRGGVTDISQPGNRANLPSQSEVGALTRRTPKAAEVKAPARKTKPNPAGNTRPAASSGVSKPKIAKTAPASRTKAASQKGAAVVERSGGRKRR